MLDAQPHHDIAAKIVSLESRLLRVHRRARELKVELKAKRREPAGLVAELPAQGVVITKLSAKDMAQAEITIERILDTELETDFEAMCSKGPGASS
jgi:hypothetical protein